jgi:hypothetical protein
MDGPFRHGMALIVGPAPCVAMTGDRADDGGNNDFAPVASAA